MIQRIKKPISVLMAVLMIFSVLSAIPFTASAETADLTISNVDEWNSFAASVKGGNTYSGQIVQMTADVGPVTTMVGGTFSGTFDGNGHKLTVNISGTATFEYVENATFQNLILAGSITGTGIHTAALVRGITGTGSVCTFKDVDIYADVNCSNSYIGGYIGNASTANTVIIEDSIFAGSLNKTGSGQGNFIGGFIGWSQQLTATIDNCAFTGSYSNIKSFNNIGFSYKDSTSITVSDFYSNVSEVFVANVNNGIRLYTPSSSYPTTVAFVRNGEQKTFYTPLSDALSGWANDSTLTLLTNVTTDSTISVTGTKTLDLNGYGITMTGSGSVISVGSGANLTLNDSNNPNTTHYYAVDNSGLAMVGNGSLSFTGGYITGGNVNGYGGGIYIDGTVTMNGGTIIGNHAERGGGVGIPQGNGKFTLNAGTISYNTASTYGGGVMNFAHKTKGLMIIRGGSITNNTGGSGGGIFSQTEIQLSGSPDISNNKKGDSSNNLVFYNYNESIIKVTDDFTPVTPIGVIKYATGTTDVTGKTGWDQPCVGAITASVDTSFNEAADFTSEDPRCAVVKAGSCRQL